MNEHAQALLDVWDAQGFTLPPYLQDLLLTTDRTTFLPENVREFAYTEQDLPINDHGVAPSIKSIYEILSLAHIKAGLNILIIGATTGYEARLLTRLQCSVTVYEPDQRCRDHASKNVPDIRHVSDISPGAYDRILAFKTLPGMRKGLIEHMPAGRAVLVIGDEHTLLTLDTDGTNEPVLTFIGSLWLPLLEDPNTQSDHEDGHVLGETEP